MLTLLAAEVSMGSAIVMGAIGFAAAIAMGIAIFKAVGSIGRQPEASDKIRGALMIGLVFIETIAIYGFLVALLILVL